MPKDTFYNLIEDKRNRIFEAAVHEFSLRRFSEASINQIIKKAGIPRGSFYQYFNDKEDLYLFMFQHILEEKKEIFRQDILDHDADVFDLCIQTTRVTLEWGRSKPAYNKISMLMEIDDSEFIMKLRMDTAKGLKELIERDKSRGFIRADVDTDVVVDMIYTLILKEYYWNGTDEKQYMKKVMDVIQIIKEGISP
ncbi:MAG: regulatory protein TetR [Herbinix sp.]|nr:regulatory protein TetR [Herbinix sp.]